MSMRLKGYLLAFAGIMLLSPDAAITRLFDGDPWTMTFYRSLGVFVMLGLLSLLTYRGKIFSYFNGLGWAGWAVVFFFAIGSPLWLLSIVYAGGPQVLTLLAIAPLVAAFASRIILGEPLSKLTIGASVFAFIGVFVTVADSFGRESFSWLGLVLSLLLPVGYSMMMVLSRKIDRPNIWPLISLGGLVMATSAIFIAPTLALTTQSQVLSVVPMILFVATFSFALLTLASRFVTAGEVTLIGLLEPVIGVVYLWWIVSEFPTRNQWIGGGIVLVVVAVYITIQMLNDPDRQTEALSSGPAKSSANDA